MSDVWVFCWSFPSIGHLMRRVFVLRTVSMVFQSSLLTVLEPSPLMKGEKQAVPVLMSMLKNISIKVFRNL